MTTLPGHEPSAMRQSGVEVRRQRQSYACDRTGIVLALGGGFSRGFAHLGVLEILEQERMPIAAIVGTSIGGLLGSAYADGIPVGKLCELGRQVRLRDFLRSQGSASGEGCAGEGPAGEGKSSQQLDRIGQFVRECFQARNVEELSIPTAIVTTDLDTGAPYVFTRGPLEVAIRASCAFPGLFRPVEYQGRLLVDGCVVSPVPTAVAAEMNASCVLGVTVGSNQKSILSASNVFRVFNRRFRILHKIMLQPSWRRKADILLEPEVHQIDWNDFSRVDEARAAGAEAMRRALPHLRRLLDRQAQPQQFGRTTGEVESQSMS